MSVLDSIDTTITLEWDETRTIGTLMKVAGRRVTITGLRVPPVGTTVHIRVDGDSAEESVTLDATCETVSETAWGEQQAEIDLLRVGSVYSAQALRSFLERYGVEQGGTVLVGRNRDNPDAKRFVYLLPRDRPVDETTMEAEAVHVLHDDPVVPHTAPIPLSGSDSEVPMGVRLEGRIAAQFKQAGAQLPGMAGGASAPRRMPSDLPSAPPIAATPKRSADALSELASALDAAGVSGDESFGFAPEDLSAALGLANDGTAVDAPGFDDPLSGPTRPDHDIKATRAIRPPSDGSTAEDGAAPTLQVATPAPAAAVAEAVKPADRYAVEEDAFVNFGPDFLADDNDGGTYGIPAATEHSAEPSTEEGYSATAHLDFDALGLGEEGAKAMVGPAAEDELDPNDVSQAAIDLDALLADDPEASLAGDQAIPAAPPTSPAPAAPQRSRYDGPASRPLSGGLGPDDIYDMSEPIYVETVGPDEPMPGLLESPGGSPLDDVQRTFGPAPTSPLDRAARGEKEPKRSEDGLEKQRQLQAIFAAPHAIRADLEVQFQDGRKKRDGVALRLSESRLRIAATQQPEPYQRLKVYLPRPDEPKKKIAVDCEVTRVREPEGEGQPGRFDLRVNGSNSPKTMAALRELIDWIEHGGPREEDEEDLAQAPDADAA